MTELLAFMTVFLLISSAVNVISVVFLCIRARTYKNDRAERNMFILALLDFFIEAAFFILYVIIYAQSEASTVAFTLIPYASDILTFSNAYLLMILNKRIRMRVLSFVRCSGTIMTKSPVQSVQLSVVVVSAAKPSK
ncbi:hypothetical protein Y032_0425g1229 [Ancylostoma ceylanicum]|uniref:Serpentine receptor class gamma n=1 Tax=Ancylostoma ceylanicum TaxID=53326 RepID=A0A016X0X6_9BILA|nr:hypothetical protein Y032_0425g1229 [Ancylostoma ceylanicum]